MARIPNESPFYVIFGMVPLLLFTAACAQTRPAARPPGALADASVEAFIAKWNEGARHGVLAMFEPDRRKTIADSPLLRHRIDAWRAVEGEVRTECGGRGEAWKTANIVFEDRRSGARVEEIHWLHLHQGGWWLYSL